MRRKRGAAIVEKLLRTQARAKALYVEADALVDRLRKVIDVGDEITLGDGRVARLVDQFAERSIVFTPSGCRRYKVEVEKRG